MKRKQNRTARHYHSEWKDSFLCAFVEGNPTCMVCLHKFTECRIYNIKRHYNTWHKKDLDAMHTQSRSKFLVEINAKYTQENEAGCSNSSYNPKNGILKASFVASHCIAKAKKPLGEGEFIKSTLISMLACLGEQGLKLMSTIEQIPLSRSTVARRIDDIALDESSDIADVSQLLIFARIIDSEFNVCEELLGCVPMFGTTKDIDIFEAVESAIAGFGNFCKMSAVCSDGAPAIKEKVSRFAGCLKAHGIDVPIFHSIVHQEALCAKSSNIDSTMQTVTSIINKIRGGHNVLKHRQFKSFLEEIDAEYSELVMYTEVRWLSRGKSLQRFFNLRKEILTFLSTNVPKSKELQETVITPTFVKSLAFLTDISKHLHDLNLNLQGKCKVIFEIVSILDGFKAKLNLLKNAITANNLTLFPFCTIISAELQDSDFASYSVEIENILLEFQSRFDDFKQIRCYAKLFFKPLTCTIEEQPLETQMELCDLQADLSLTCSTEFGLAFWKSVPSSRYPVLRNIALQYGSMFGSTYICKSALMTFIKNDYRSRLTNINLQSLLRMSISNIEIDFDTIVEEYSKRD